MKRITGVLLLLFLVSGCATAYKAKGYSGGYSSTQLGENIFQVTFVGNGKTSRERANDFALLRSAEIALANNFEYFVIEDTQQYSKHSTYTTPRTAYGGGQTFNISKPRVSNTIALFKDKPEGFAYRASFVIKSMEDKYGL